MSYTNTNPQRTPQTGHGGAFPPPNNNHYTTNSQYHHQSPTPQNPPSGFAFSQPQPRGPPPHEPYSAYSSMVRTPHCTFMFAYVRYLYPPPISYNIICLSHKISPGHIHHNLLFVNPKMLSPLCESLPKLQMMIPHLMTS